MNRKIEITSDIFVLIITGIWISELNFKQLTIIQIIGLILTVFVILLMILKLIKRGE